MCIRDRAGCRAGSAECLAYVLAWMRVVWLRGRCWWVAGWAGSAGCPEPLSNGQDQMCGIEGRPPDQRVFGTPSGFNVPKRPSQTRVTVHDQVCESCCSSHTSAGGSERGVRAGIECQVPGLMETIKPGGTSMVAPRKYPEELRERSIRMTLDARQDPASRPSACRRIGEQLGINPETLRGWVTQA